MNALNILDIAAIVNPHNDKLIAEGRANRLASENSALRADLAMRTGSPREVLSTIAHHPSALGAAKEIAHALGISDADLAEHMLGHVNWTRASIHQRLTWLGEWLRSECLAIHERDQVMTTGPDPIDTVGTRD